MAHGEVLNPQTDRRLKINKPPHEQRPTREQLIGFRFPPDLVEAFRIECERSGCTMTQVAEQGIRTWIRRQQRKHNQTPTV